MRGRSAPATPTATRSPLRPTRRIWRERESLESLIHRYELFNRQRDVRLGRGRRAATAGNRRFPPSQSDLSSWKTLLRCEKDADAVRGLPLRSRARVYLTPFAADDRLALPIAA